MIGNGQFGNTSGDFDFYSFTASVDDTILFDIDSDTDTVAGIFDSSGNLLASFDDEILGALFDPKFFWTPEANGTYYLCVGGYSAVDFFPSDPFTAGTGAGGGDKGN